jgi:hypothetical protein
MKDRRVLRRSLGFDDLLVHFHERRYLRRRGRGLVFVTGRRKVSFGSFRSNSELTRGIPARRLVVSAVIGEGLSSIVAALLAGGRIGRACDGSWYNICRDALCERYNC